MAANEKKSLKNTLSGSGRMLTIIGGSVLVAVVVGMFTLNSFLSNQGPSAQARLQGAPESAGVPTGEGGDEEYQRLIAERNRIAEQRALTQGTSAFPTLNAEGLQDDGEFCDLNCANERARLERELAEAAERERQLQRDLENARLAAAQTQGAQGTRDYYEHNGFVYMSPEYQAQDRRRMREEMSRLAETHRPRGAEFVATSGVINRVNQAATNAASSVNDGGLINAGGASSLPQSFLIDAGHVLYATLDMEANSDVPGPLRATIQGGEYNGARVLGEFKVSNDYLVISFSRMVLPTGEHLAIDAIGIDPDRRLIGMADRVDRHYLQRFGAVLGAAFLQGYGKAVLASREVQVGTGDNAEIVSTIDTTKDKALAAMAEVGDELAGLVRPFASRPPTVIKYADTGMGLMFLSPVERR